MPGPKPTAVHFVIWPSGEVMEGTQTSVHKDVAIQFALEHLLPSRFFPGVVLHPSRLLASELWAAMKRSGFRVHSIEVPADIAGGVSR